MDGKIKRTIKRAIKKRPWPMSPRVIKRAVKKTFRFCRAVVYRIKYYCLWWQMGSQGSSRTFVLPGKKYCIRVLRSSDPWNNEWYSYLALHHYGPVPCYGSNVKVCRRPVTGKNGREIVKRWRFSRGEKIING